jgi:hypothetical protein
MMSSKLKTFNSVFNNVVAKNLKFLYFTRAIEYQKDAISDLKSLLKRTSSLKKKIISQKNEELSNQLLSLQSLLIAYISELEMYVSLKDQRMDDAWESLVNAQDAMRTAFQANEIVEKYNGDAYLQKLEQIEKSFFPHQTFNSIEAKAEYSDCSICGKKYGTCNHLVGKPYMGEICYQIPRKIEFTGLALIINADPGSKHHRITEVSDNGYMRNFLTWRISNKVEEKK